MSDGWLTEEARRDWAVDGLRERLPKGHGSCDRKRAAMVFPVTYGLENRPPFDPFSTKRWDRR